MTARGKLESFAKLAPDADSMRALIAISVQSTNRRRSGRMER